MIVNVQSGEEIGSMKTNLSEVLGEKLVDNKHFDIYRKGIADEYRYIFWDDIDLIYIGGEKNSVNFATTYEERTIIIVDKKTPKTIEFSVSSILWDLGKKKEQLFSEIYSIILTNTSQQQWTKFIQSLQAGESLYFDAFVMTKDAIFVPKMFGKDKQISLSQVTGCFLSNGQFYIKYQEKQKSKSKKVGEVSIIPNIHILQTFFKLIPEEKLRITNTSD
jgi:hypothetical protein